ncbi:MAG TPA: carboxypeptidase-like regulatory domain-containing protein, partial [Bryobacteraceae bacterium]|nr:carboxypeptidase-like regulatory domain-containing protein [Bryobacteraceae bacterium]
MRQFRFSTATVLFLCLFAFTQPAFAQSTGTIYGTVLDASGAAVAGARVTALNTETNLARTIETGDTGQFTIPLLPVGTYSVKVERSGFNPFEQTGVLLQVNTNVQVDASLQVRGATEQVVVTAEQTLVQTNSTSLVQVVDQRRIADLPLNGRNILQLTTLNAGISDSGAAGSTVQNSSLGSGFYNNVSISVNGSRGDGTNYLLDNADNNDSYTNIASPFPNPDAIQEFSIQSSTFDAQYGRNVGGVVNVVTRSGSNQLHGSLFEFLRNKSLNAGNFFSGRDALKRNQFGGSFGGPIYLPKLYDGRNKSFFFFSYQGTRQATATPGALAIAPSEAMKRGDLSAWLTADGRGAIRDPLVPGTYFPNNQIPVSRFDPVAAKLLSYMPTSTTSNYNYRFQTPSQLIKDDQILLRLDHSLTDRQRLSFRYFWLRYDQPWVFIPDNLMYLSVGQTGPTHNATLNYVNVISPRLVNEFSATHQGLWPVSSPPADLNVNFPSLGARTLIASQP